VIPASQKKNNVGAGSSVNKTKIENNQIKTCPFVGFIDPLKLLWGDWQFVGRAGFYLIFLDGEMVCG
jgi:hypothetical protein